MSYDTPAASTAAAPAAETAVQVARPRLAIAPVTDPAEWASLLAQAPKAYLPQAFAYGEGKRAEGWTVQRLCFHDNDNIIAFCQMLEKRVAGLRLLSRVNRGPIFLGDPPCPIQVGNVYRTLRQERRRWHSPLLIAPALEATPENLGILASAGLRQRKGRGWQSMRIDLGRSEEAIRASLAPGFRNRLRAAERSGLTLRIANDEATAKWMLERHEDNKREKRFKGAEGTFIRALRAAATDDYLVFQAVLDGEPVAGMSVVRFGQLAEYHTGWFGPAGRAANAGNLLMWAILSEMKRRGCAQFDAGGIHDSHGYTQFKRGLRGSEFALAGEWIAF